MIQLESISTSMSIRYSPQRPKKQISKADEYGRYTSRILCLSIDIVFDVPLVIDELFSLGPPTANTAMRCSCVNGVTIPTSL